MPEININELLRKSDKITTDDPTVEVEEYNGYIIMTKEFYVAGLPCLAKFIVPQALPVGKIEFSLTGGTDCKEVDRK